MDYMMLEPCTNECIVIHPQYARRFIKQFVLKEE